MRRLTEIQSKLPSLQAWLAQNGAEVLRPTNAWEILRFRSGGETAVIYRKKGGSLTFTGCSEEAVTAFFEGRAWRGNPATNRKSTSPAIRTVRDRDGDDCFACGWPVSFDDESIDHLVELTAGGPNHISNYVLMHVVCNQQCAGMSASQKIRMHVEMRLAKEKGA